MILLFDIYIVYYRDIYKSFCVRNIHIELEQLDSISWAPPRAR